MNGKKRIGEQSVKDYSEAVSPAFILSSADRGWQGFEAMRMRQIFDVSPVISCSNHVVVVHLSQPLTIFGKMDSRLQEKRMGRNDIAVIPANVPSQWSSRQPTPVESLHLTLEPAFVNAVAEGGDIYPDKIELVGQLGAQNRFIEEIGKAFLAELQANYGSGRLYAESLASVLAAQLIKEFSAIKNAIAFAPHGGLTPQRLRRAVEFINENLDQDLSLSEIAAAAEVSVSHFARLFKLSTGFAPHRFLLERRLERAKELLLTTKLSITEICFTVGFQNPSHFTATFRRATGITPREFRRN